MKVLTVLLILCCIGVYANDRQIITECFAQYGIDYGKLSERNVTKKQAVEEVTPYKMGCVSVCYLKKQLVDEIPMKKHIIDSLNEVQTRYSEAEMDEYKDAANKCIIEVKEDECKLFECLKPWDSPIGRLIGINYG